jgi:hypothetical protein
MEMEKINSPAWFYGPNGQAKIFGDPSDVPAGWQDHPSKVGKAKSTAPAKKPEPATPLDL